MKRALPYILLAVGAIMIVLGVWGGEVATVLCARTNICLECIGIG
jgi:hypothetical protein